MKNQSQLEERLLSSLICLDVNKALNHLSGIKTYMTFVTNIARSSLKRKISLTITLMTDLPNFLRKALASVLQLLKTLQ
jgi:hypothetical protein